MRLYNFRDFDEVYGFTRKIKKPAEFPPYVTFEITSHCNLRCTMCLHTYMKRDQRHMDYGIFKKAVDEIAEYGSAVRFIGLSEPFLYPRIIEASEYVKSKGLLLHMTNNGTVINENLMEKMIDIGLDSIIFSMQGLTEEEYGFMRNTDKYGIFMANLKKLYNMRGNGKKPFIKLTTTITNRDDPNNKERFKKEYGKFCDAVQITGITCFNRIAEDYGCSDIYERLGIDRPKKMGGIRCTAAYYEMLINSNGKVSPCCDDGDEGFVVGDVAKQSLKEIWDGKLLKSVRDILDSGSLNLLANCRNCGYGYELGYDQVMKRTTRI